MSELRARYRYDKDSHQAVIELHRHGNLVESFSVAEAGKLVEQIILHLTMAYYDLREPK